jgi:hypothetical protein
MTQVSRRVLILSAILFYAFIAAQAQTTAFTYQGRLSDGANPANGTYQMQFALYDVNNV